MIKTIKKSKTVDDIHIFLENLSSDQKAEDEFLKQSEIESASAELYKSLFLKIPAMLIFEDILNQFKLDFGNTMLELGGGIGLLSAYIKKISPTTHVVFSDVAMEAVKKSAQFESFFNVKIDEKWIVGAEETPFDSASFDSILFYASFHHVQDPKATMKECARLLIPGGRLYFIMEPSCPFYLKPLYDYHVRRETVKEHYYSRSEYKELFRSSGFDVRLYNYKNIRNRLSNKSTAYYLLMNLIPDFMTSLFPCSQLAIGVKIR